MPGFKFCAEAAAARAEVESFSYIHILGLDVLFGFFLTAFLAVGVGLLGQLQARTADSLNQ